MTDEEIQQAIAALKAEKETVARNIDRVAGFSAEHLKDYRVQLFEDADLLKVKDAALTLVDDKVISLEGWGSCRNRTRCRSVAGYSGCGL